MANPRLRNYPALNVKSDTYRMTPDDIYDYAYNLRNAVEKLQGDTKVRPEDRRLILAFLQHIKAKQVSVGRQAKYVWTLRRMALLMPVPFRRAKRRHIEEMVTRLGDHEITVKGPRGVDVNTGRHYSAATMSDFRMNMKVFMKFVRYGDTDKETPYPDEVKWLKEGVKRNERQEPLYFTDQEAEAMIQAAGKDRDKAFISLGHELGLRVSENLLLRVGDVQFDDFGALVHVRRGKTGSRTVRAIACVRYLADYLEKHSYRKDPNAPLWLTSSTNHIGEPLSWVGADRMVKEAGKRAGIQKQRMHMYMFRHGSATRNAKYLTDSELKLMYGWTMDSRMPSVYIHLSGGDLDQKYQQVYGSGRPVEPPKPSFAPTVCPRCGDKASPGMRFCPKCATPLDQAERAKAAAEEAQTRQEISELRRLVEKSLNPQASGEGQGSSPDRTS